MIGLTPSSAALEFSGRRLAPLTHQLALHITHVDVVRSLPGHAPPAPHRRRPRGRSYGRACWDWRASSWRMSSSTATTCQSAAAPDLPRRLRLGDRRPRGVAEVDLAISPCAVRQARPHDPRPARRHRGRVSKTSQQRPRGTDQHTDPADHPTWLRLPLTRRRDRPGDAVARRTLPTQPWWVSDPRNRQ